MSLIFKEQKNWLKEYSNIPDIAKQFQSLNIGHAFALLPINEIQQHCEIVFYCLRDEFSIWMSLDALREVSNQKQ